MRSPTLRRRAFTLIEMLVVMAIIAILAAILLNLNALVQSRAARTRADGEKVTMSAGCEAYKADNGSYPQNDDTDKLDPRTDGDPNSNNYKNASLYLYKQLSGDLNANERNEPNGTPPEPRNYLSDFFTPQRMGVNSGIPVGSVGRVLYIKDPYGNPYGYSTLGLKAEQKFRTDVTTDPKAPRTANQGYNPTFDLWSTAGKTSNPSSDPTVVNAWVKNW